MKFASTIFIIALVLFLVSIGPADSATLRQDYRKLETKRQKLERQRIDYEKKLKTLRRHEDKMSVEFYHCVSQKSKANWKQKLENAKLMTGSLEAVHQNIENKRKEFDRMRRDLERSRIEIEKKHRRKGKGTDYENDFRQYMGALESQYLHPLEQFLLKDCREQIAETEKYLEFLKKSTAICK